MTIGDDPLTVTASFDLKSAPLTVVKGGFGLGAINIHLPTWPSS